MKKTRSKGFVPRRSKSASRLGTKASAAEPFRAVQPHTGVYRLRELERWEPEQGGQNIAECRTKGDLSMAEQSAEKVSKQTTSYCSDVHGHGSVVAIIQNHFQAQKIEVERAKFKIENSTRLALELDDAVEDCSEELSESAVEQVREATEQSIELRSGEARQKGCSSDWIREALKEVKPLQSALSFILPQCGRCWGKD